jgi:hypothetical protein
MFRKLKDMIGREVRNDNGKLPWVAGMEIVNSNGDLDPASLGYQYTIQTTSFIRSKVIAQKFYKTPPADFFSVIPGTGAWMENIKTNATYDVAGPFEQGIIGNASGPAQIPTVDVGTSPLSAKVHTWAKGYVYTVPEVKKALASSNWDPVSSKMEALKRQWDLGIQKIGFLGLLGDLTLTPGLLTNAAVSIDTTTITENISAMSADDFATFVATILGVFSENSNFTAMPTMFVIPQDDFLGLITPVSATFPMVNKLTYLLDAFKAATGNSNFQIKPLAYCQKDFNAGYVVDASGRNRYALYNNEVETVAMDLPVDFQLTPAGTKNNYQFEGVGAGQFTGCIVYRPREFMYFDHT